MSFDTLYFFCFFLVVYFCHRLTPLKGAVLLAASILFYAAAGLRDSAIFVALIGVNFTLSFRVASSRAWLGLAIGCNVAVLAFFKYRYFVLGDALATLTWSSAAIPLGISFYTFQAIAYFVDLSRGTGRLERSFPRFFLFKAFFPQLIAGPIVRGRQLLPQLSAQWQTGRARRRLTVLALGVICLGVVKKVVFADSLAPTVDDIFTHGPADALTGWLGAFLFAFQIYFDFSGYSDMAVGMAALLGIRLPINFRQPYLAASPREFWQRWHITLSTWIRDYLYIPLGGSRAGGPARRLLVMLAVMGLAGLWHGASWNFIVWGLVWGAVIALWRVLPEQTALPRAVPWLATLLIVVLLWVIFRAPDLATAFVFLHTMIGGPAGGSASYGSGWPDPLIAAAAIGGLLVLHRAEAALTQHRFILALRAYDTPFIRGCLIAVVAWLLLLPKTNMNPFIYFRF